MSLSKKVRNLFNTFDSTYKILIKIKDEKIRRNKLKEL